MIFFAAATLVTIALIPPIKKLAFKIGAVDEPSKRRVHDKPTARFGGVAIFIGICVCCGLAAIGVTKLD